MTGMDFIVDNGEPSSSLIKKESLGGSGTSLP